MNDKEQVYDEQIYPLMDSIIKICKEHQIPMFSVFQFTPNDTCVSVVNKFIRPSSYLIYTLFAAYECREAGDCFNIDKFLCWLLNQPEAENSIFLRQYIKDRDANKQADIK